MHKPFAIFDMDGTLIDSMHLWSSLYLEAASRLGAVPSEIAVYEDALYTIETAKKANFYVVAVSDTESADHWEKICRLADETITFH